MEEYKFVLFNKKDSITISGNAVPDMNSGTCLQLHHSSCEANTGTILLF